MNGNNPKVIFENDLWFRKEIELKDLKLRLSASDYLGVEPEHIDHLHIPKAQIMVDKTAAENIVVKLNKLESENKKLREGLEFYADHKKYLLTSNVKIFDDQGKLAQQILKEIDNVS